MTTYKLEDLTVYSDIQAQLSRITPEQIESFARKLKPNELDSSKVIGMIDCPSTRAMFTLYRRLTSEETLERALAGSAVDEIADEQASVGIRAGWLLVREPTSAGGLGFIELMGRAQP